MKTQLILVGKTDSKIFSEAIDIYVGRLKHYITFEPVVIPDIKNTKKLTEEQQKKLEGDCILKLIQPGDTVVLLDEAGKEMRSVEFAEWMRRKMNATSRKLIFVIGGPYGFSKEVYERAYEKISLSKMTFSHQMVRLIFFEQLYRAMTILNGEPYHHE